MKTMNLNNLSIGGMSIALAAFVAGCASSGYKKSEQTASSLQSSANRIESASLQLHLAAATLNDLINNPQSDLRPQFKKFSTAAGRAESLAGSTQEAAASLQARGVVHFDNWDKELAAIQNESIRARGQSRRQEVFGQYEKVLTACTNALTEYGPVLSDLKDVHRFLNADLTTGGLAAIKDTATRINQRAAPVQDSVNKLVADMRALATAMSPQVATEK